MQAKHSIQTYIDKLSNGIWSEQHQHKPYKPVAPFYFEDFAAEMLETQTTVFTAAKPEDKWKILFHIHSPSCCYHILKQKFWHSVAVWLTTDKTFIDQEHLLPIDDMTDSLILIYRNESLRSAIRCNTGLMGVLKKYVQQTLFEKYKFIALLREPIFYEFLADRKFDVILLDDRLNEKRSEFLAFYNEKFGKEAKLNAFIERDLKIDTGSTWKTHHFFPYLSIKSLLFYYYLPENLCGYIGKTYNLDAKTCQAEFRKYIRFILPRFFAAEHQNMDNETKDLIEKLLQELLSEKQYAQFFELIFHIKPKNFLSLMRNVLVDLLKSKAPTEINPGWVEKTLQSLFLTNSKISPGIQEFFKGYFYQTCCELGISCDEETLLHYQKAIALTKQNKKNASQAAIPPSLDDELADEAAFFIAEKLYLGFIKFDPQTEGLAVDYAGLNLASEKTPFPILQSRACLAYPFLLDNKHPAALQLIGYIRRIINGFNDTKADPTLDAQGEKTLALYSNRRTVQAFAPNTHLNSLFFSRKNNTEYLPLDPSWERDVSLKSLHTINLLELPHM